MRRIEVSAPVKYAAMAALLAQGVIHLIEAPQMYAEVPYLGVLFVLTLAGAVVASVGMLRDEAWGWLLGFATAAGPLAGYILSRSVGIPLLHETAVANILEPLGVACVAAEALVVMLAARAISIPADRRLWIRATD